LKKTVGIILAGSASTVVMILISTLIHGVIFEDIWSVVSFMRPVDSPPFMPGVPIATFVWNVIIALFFVIFYKSLPQKGFIKGLVYGFYLVILFVLFVELWNYLQFDLPFETVIAGIITYLIALPLGGGLISLILHKMKIVAE
jgi:hypothetical protein